MKKSCLILIKKCKCVSFIVHYKGLNLNGKITIIGMLMNSNELATTVKQIKLCLTSSLMRVSWFFCRRWRLFPGVVTTRCSTFSSCLFTCNTVRWTITLVSNSNKMQPQIWRMCQGSSSFVYDHLNNRNFQRKYP